MTRRQPLKPIEVTDGHAGSRTVARIGYGLLVAAVAGLVVLLFVRFTGSMLLAVLLVGFMLGYMGVLGWLAMRNIEGKR